MLESDIVIIGGGPAGLSTAGALKSIGLEPKILDKDDRIGGTWRRRYERLRLHTARAFSGLAGLPLPPHFPRYVSKDQYAGYLQDYAAHFHLDHTFNSTVRKVGGNGNGQAHDLIVETDEATWRSRVVVLATGQYGNPFIPDWPGLADYRGTLLHSARYKSGRDFAGRRVLVIGVGNSGAEIAADLAEQGAAFVGLSIRTQPPIVPRELFGVPVQVFGILMSRLPPRLADRMASALVRLSMGDLTRLGFRRPDWLPFTARRIPVIDVGLVGEVGNGRVKVRPNIARFTRTGVTFTDGQAESFDAVVAATGFTAGLERWVEVPGVLDEQGLPLSPHGQPTTRPGLFFMGFIETQRGLLYETGLASPRLAKAIRKYLAIS